MDDRLAGRELKAKVPLSAPRLDGNFDTREVSKLPSFLRKNSKKQGFERKYFSKPCFYISSLFPIK